LLDGLSGWRQVVLTCKVEVGAKHVADQQLLLQYIVVEKPDI